MHFQVAPSSTTHLRLPSDKPPELSKPVLDKLLTHSPGPGQAKRLEEVAQWVNCDIRSFDYSVLGQYVPSTLPCRRNTTLPASDETLGSR